MNYRTPRQLAEDLLELTKKIAYGDIAAGEMSLDLNRATSTILHGQVVNLKAYKDAKKTVGLAALRAQVSELNILLLACGRKPVTDVRYQ